MKILVVADTHMPRMSKRLPSALLRELTDAAAIIHAGDWTRMSVYEALAAYAPVYGVVGNNDGPEIAARFGMRELLTLDGCRIGVVHGHGAPLRTKTEAYALSAFKSEKLDAIVYGHSHVPILRREPAGGMLIFNPGSPTDKRRQPRYSFGIMETKDGKLSARHVYYTDKS
ncbi:metallophosphoesterase family protein [Cohnella sp. JJ-181]|uniref:metallophosphoesterase family protein n=1 Tax=Cohnella rhizoplanae TaxID=2974897 RepID=UPI0022FF8849|nr:metallophosphoesterase [Cohnella sp. JJ-181]CAI6033145.1 Putative metallophosphoesterase MG207 [Cohnella sp. JJ-181]